MTKRMLIDATHAEETRVVVLDGNRLEDFDVETSTKRQLKGNIYLAKVVRVEPSLQAAFVEYGGNRHGFLAFSEIHPDYYQIPVADRQRLIEIQAEEARQEEEEEDRAAEAAASGTPAEQPSLDAETAEPRHEAVADTEEPEYHAAQPTLIDVDTITAPVETLEPVAQPIAVEAEAAPVSISDQVVAELPFAAEAAADTVAEIDPTAGVSGPAEAEPPGEPEATAEAPEPGEDTEPRLDADAREDAEPATEMLDEQPPPEVVGGEADTAEEARERRIPSRFLRNYKIQEVIKRRQILLVQVVKEERGTKGAALTTYLSLAGRFCVLMPNSPRGGGISRKITSPADRRRLKEITSELQIAQGMGLIVRTAGANRPKPEIKRDCEYLLRLWDDIREHTLKSVAPAQIYEEASLIKRAIRDVYSRDIDEIQVDGEAGWHAAHDFMRMLMPSHAKKVQLWRNGGQPLFAKYQVESQLDGMLLPIVQLRSGGYLVINQTEALVAIDVNSGRSTRERGIEETALRTNLEAADEVARQLRLRDLAGLIVIDLIDMEARKHNAMVERRLKEALKNDRARIQVGSISHFGLLEMSRQRLRPSLAETSFIACPHCAGTGHVRSTESAAIHVLRAIEDEGSKRRSAEIVVYVATPVALYILNHKRERLGEIEARYGMHVACLGDDTQLSAQYRIERVRAQVAGETPVSMTQEVPPLAAVAAEAEAEAEVDEDEVAVEEDEEEVAEAAEAAPGDGTETAEEAEHRRRRRRRRRRGGRREDAEPAPAAPPAFPEAAAETAVSETEVAETHIEGVPEHAEAAADEDQRARRRGRRGGRRRRQDGAEGVVPSVAEPGADQPDLPPVYIGPTPANPFGGHTFDIFDVMEQAEQNAAAAELSRPVTAAPSAIQPGAEPVIIETEPLPIQLEATPAAAEEDAPNTPSPATRGRAGEGEPQATPSRMFEPEPVSESEPEPEPEPEPARAVEPEPEPEPPVAANDAAPEPAIKPIIIGADETQVVEKKRGWWRR